MVNLSFSLVTFEYFLMIVVRVASFVAVAPFYGTNNTPRRVKIGFSVMVAILLFQILERPALDYEGVSSAASDVYKRQIDMEIGLSMATEYDPMNNTQVNITGQLYNYLLLLLLIATDMHHYILHAVVDSYKLIPVNGQVFQWDHLFQSFLTYMTDLFVIAFRIILPIFAVMMILNCILGIMAKVAPQMNMFAIGMQMKILIGFLIMFLTIRLLPSISNFVFKEMKKLIVSFIEGMY